MEIQGEIEEGKEEEVIVKVEGRDFIEEVYQANVLENEESEESEEGEDDKADVELMGDVDFVGQDEGNIKDFRFFCVYNILKISVIYYYSNVLKY